MTNIAIGQYYPTKSYIHDLDPRLKIVATMLYICFIFFADNIWGYGISIFYMVGVIFMSKVPFKYLIKGLRGIIFILVITVSLNILFTTGDRVLFHYGIITISVEGIVLAVKMGVRLVLLVVASSIMTLTTSPIQLTDGIEFLLNPLKKIGVPAHEIAMMMTIALRFIPTLLEEADKIMKAQMARGAEFDTGGIIKKAKSLIPLLVPLFISSFRHADDLAMAMESRCYRGDVNRTKMKQMKMISRDYFAGGIVCCFCVMVVGSRFL